MRNQSAKTEGERSTRRLGVAGLPPCLHCCSFPLAGQGFRSRASAPSVPGLWPQGGRDTLGRTEVPPTPAAAQGLRASGSSSLKFVSGGTIKNPGSLQLRQLWVTPQCPVGPRGREQQGHGH